MFRIVPENPKTPRKRGFLLPFCGFSSLRVQERPVASKQIDGIFDGGLPSGRPGTGFHGSMDDIAWLGEFKGIVPATLGSVCSRKDGGRSKDANVRTEMRSQAEGNGR